MSDEQDTPSRNLDPVLCSAYAGSRLVNVRPLHDRIIVRRLEEGEQASGAVIIPDTAREKSQPGEMIAAGREKANDDGGM